MAEPTRNGVKVTVEIWVDNGRLTFSSDDRDFGKSGLIGNFIQGSAAERHARELLQKHGKLPA
jgi:hypothetical protein